MDARDEAIQHIVSSAKYWADDNLHSDHSFNCRANLGLKDAFDMAVSHVKTYHYPELSDDDMAIAKGMCELK